MTPRDWSARPTGRTLGLAAAGALAAAAIAAWRLSLPGGDAADPGHIVTLAETGQTAPPAVRLAIPAASRGPLPASLAGTSVDGGLTLDGAGHFVPDRNALRLFDYFFSAAGEESAEILRGRILLHAMGAGVQDKALAEIATVLDRYIAYRDAARAALAAGGAGSSDLAGRVAEMRALQAATLGPELAAAFYGDDTALADMDMRRLTVLRDPSMTPAERQRALASLDAGLPLDVREARTAATAPADLHRRVEDLRATGASSAEIAAVRRSEYGAAAAERLAVLDGQRAKWDGRLAAYRSAVQELRSAYGGPGSPAYRQALDALRQRQFSAAEILRVRALDAEME
jgi:lipase chaperone LimK